MGKDLDGGVMGNIEELRDQGDVKERKSRVKCKSTSADFRFSIFSGIV